MAMLGALFTLAVGWAIQDIYTNLDATTIRLCAVEARQWEAVTTLGQRVTPEYTPPLLPPLPRQCRAKPGETFWATPGP
jgi:hypothetical protein